MGLVTRFLVSCAQDLYYFVSVATQGLHIGEKMKLMNFSNACQHVEPPKNPPCPPPPFFFLLKTKKGPCVDVIANECISEVSDMF